MLFSNKKPAFRRVTLLGCNWSPALERRVLSGFEAGQLRYERNAHFNVETEIAPVSEHDANSASVIRGSGFDVMHGLAGELGKRGTPCALLAGRFTLSVSHCRLSEQVILVRAAVVLKHDCSPTAL
jgi:hypothetical protein